MSPLFSIIGANLLTSIIALIGLMFFKKNLSEKLLYYFVSFAAGVMLATAFLDLLPEASETSGKESIFIPTLLGIVFFFLTERFVLWFHHHDDTHNLKPSAILVLVGDALHNFFDGIAIAATFLINPSLGLVTTLAIIAHEIPQEIADFSILVHGGMDKKKALFLNFISALTALMGGLVGYYFLNTIDKISYLAVSFTAGAFIYIACSDLIPEMHHDFKKGKRWSQTLSFLFGIMVIYFVGTFFQH